MSFFKVVLTSILIFPVSSLALSPSSDFLKKTVTEQEFITTLQFLCDWLAERNVEDLEGEKADTIFIFGNDELRVFKMASYLYGKRVSRKIIVSGGVGRLTIPLLQNELVWQNLIKQKSPLDLDDLQQAIELLKDETNLETIRKTLDPFDLSEAMLMKSLLVAKGVLKEDIIVEPSSIHTAANVQETYRLFAENPDLLLMPTSFLLLQTPIGQRRARAVFLRHWPNAKNLKIISYAPFRYDVSFLNPEEGMDLAQKVIAEILRFIAYGQLKDWITLDQPIPATVLQGLTTLIHYLGAVPSLPQDLQDAYHVLVAASLEVEISL